jgi:ATP-binding cassette subfamily B protein
MKNNNMHYRLPAASTVTSNKSLGGAWESLRPLLTGERKNLLFAIAAVLTSSAANLLSPFIIARVVDTAIATHNFVLVLQYSALLFAVFVVGLSASYVQTIRMGTVGRSVLFKMRNELFTKLASLPVSFFTQNKSGDLISRINSDTDKLNQFFAQALMQFFGNFFVIIGAGILLVTLHPLLGLYALLPAFCVLGITQILSTWVKRTARTGLNSVGALSGEIQESLANFKVIIASNRLDYFRQKFDHANTQNYTANVEAGIASNLFTPLYALAANSAQLIVLGYGITLIMSGQLTVGILIGYLLYVSSFYSPLRQLASVWTSLQLALASLDRIGEVVDLQSNLVLLDALATDSNSTETSQHQLLRTPAVLSFNAVSYNYPDGKEVLTGVTLSLEKGKTYALVGPTGGGKTTIASLMARLFDPSEGIVLLKGKDIRTYTDEERTNCIGFILQEPFLFSGTVAENIMYGNKSLMALGRQGLEAKIESENLQGLIARFSEGLDTPITSSGDGISLGQKQLVAFMRAVLRAPELLILDEATANIDTVTEQLLDQVLESLPKSTTKVIIAHRLNTIENADSIYFVHAGTVVEAGTMEKALEMLMGEARSS